jgi:prepilin-type N-terminal cleavage/methylation domain-containing protein
MQEKQKKCAGFTLIELIITTAIIAFLATFVLADYRNAGERTTLRLETQKFIGDVRRVENMALGSLDFNGTTPVGGWGIYIANTSTYYVFVDNDAVGTSNHGRYTAGDTVAETVTLSVKALFSAGVGSSVVFVPPDPLVYINGTDSGTLTVTLREAADAAVTRNVLINSFGLVDAGS